jgi:hypothetical protein
VANRLPWPIQRREQTLKEEPFSSLDSVELQDFFLGVLIAGISCVNAGVPVAAWVRAHDGRFLLLAAANAVLAVIGAIWAWGVLPLSPPSFAAPQFPILLLVLLVVLLLLATTLWPRRA